MVVGRPKHFVTPVKSKETTEIEKAVGMFVYNIYLNAYAFNSVDI